MQKDWLEGLARIFGGVGGFEKIKSHADRQPQPFSNYI